jgi:quercetin dioxygenase-like cupin family protein
MARAGETISNPVTGETVTFLVTAADSGGSLLRLELEVAPGSAGVAEHVHPKAVERHELQAGRLEFRVAGTERTLAPGDRLEIPPGTPHSFRNPGPEPARDLVENAPAGKFETFMETVYAFAREGKTNARGLPRNPLQAAVIAHAYLDDIALPKLPLGVQRVLFGAGSAVGRLFGFRAQAE